MYEVNVRLFCLRTKIACGWHAKDFKRHTQIISRSADDPITDVSSCCSIMPIRAAALWLANSNGIHSLKKKMPFRPGNTDAHISFFMTYLSSTDGDHLLSWILLCKLSIVQHDVFKKFFLCLS